MRVVGGELGDGRYRDKEIKCRRGKGLYILIISTYLCIKLESMIISLSVFMNC